MLDKIHWLGHDTFRINAGKIIYTDPYKISGGQKADIIFITHDHYDHFSLKDIEKIATPKTKFVGPACVTKNLKGDVTTVKAGDKTTVDGIPIEVIAAYNMNKDYHPLSKGYVGYIFTINDTRIYHSGDVDVIPEMKQIVCDIALLPVGGTYTMTAQAAAEAVKKFKVKTVIPMHWGTVVGSIEDAEEFQRLCPDNVEVKILPKE